MRDSNSQLPSCRGGTLPVELIRRCLDEVTTIFTWAHIDLYTAPNLLIWSNRSSWLHGHPCGLLEHMGFEPMALCLQSKCSPIWAKAPWCRSKFLQTAHPRIWPAYAIFVFCIYNYLRMIVNNTYYITLALGPGIICSEPFATLQGIGPWFHDRQSCVIAVIP